MCDEQLVEAERIVAEGITLGGLLVCALDMVMPFVINGEGEFF